MIQQMAVVQKHSQCANTIAQLEIHPDIEIVAVAVAHVIEESTVVLDGKFL